MKWKVEFRVELFWRPPVEVLGTGSMKGFLKLKGCRTGFGGRLERLYARV